MAYTESLCLMLLLATAVAIRTRKHWIIVALLCGVATSARSVGIAAVLPTLLYTWVSATGFAAKIRQTSIGLLLGLTGLLAFLTYQWVAYHSPFAFIHIQDSYRMRPVIPADMKIVKLVELEPIRAAFDGKSNGYWGELSMSKHNPECLVSMMFWNPIYFVATTLLVGLGIWLRWMDRYAVLFAAGLILIPYVTRGYDFGMCSQSRFMILCFPAYIVLGRIAAGLPDYFRVPVAFLACTQMVAFTALFAAGYPLF